MLADPLDVLDDAETRWAPVLKSVSLVAESGIDETTEHPVAMALGRLYSSWEQRRLVFRRWPACTAVVMTSVAATHYAHGAYWPSLWDIVGYPGTGNHQTEWGRGFQGALDLLGLPVTSRMNLSLLGPILMHTGLPTYCLTDFYRLLAERRAQDPSLDADGFIRWATAEGHESRMVQVNKPVQQLLRDGAQFALDVVDRAMDLLDRLQAGDTDVAACGLPGRFVNRAREFIGDGGLKAFRPRTGPVPRRERPRLELDPYDKGLCVVLPAVPDQSDGAEWRVVFDGEATTVPSRPLWPGSAEGSPRTEVAVPRPVRLVNVSLLGENATVTLPLYPSAIDPLLLFDEHGRVLPRHAQIPPEPVWALFPTERQLEVPDSHIRVDGSAPAGWAGWALQLISAEGLTRLGLAGLPESVREISTMVRPGIDPGAPVAGVQTPYGTPVHSALPAVTLPSRPVESGWTVELTDLDTRRRRALREYRTTTKIRIDDIWDNLPRPVLGAFELTVRGALGVDQRWQGVVCEGLDVTYTPGLRRFGANGLDPTEAHISVLPGANAGPSVVSLGATDRNGSFEVVTADERETFAITPPSVRVALQHPNWTDAWCSSPLSLITEDFEDSPGTLLVHAPGRTGAIDLIVNAGVEQVQQLDPSVSFDLARFDLTHLSDTVRARQRAELVARIAGENVTVARIRPARLAESVHQYRGKLVLGRAARDLTAVVYLACAPWRPPKEFRVGAGGAVDLPVPLRDAGPLLVHLAIKDSWAPTEWPDWPEPGNYLPCDSGGHPRGISDEELALAMFLAGHGPCPERITDLRRLWLVLQRREHVVVEKAEVMAACVRAFHADPLAAVEALLETTATGSVHPQRLIETGLAASAFTRTPKVNTAVELWNRAPAATVLLPAFFLTNGDVRAAAASQCGEDLRQILDRGSDMHASGASFGPMAVALDGLTPEQAEHAYQQAKIVPTALLSADNRAAAAYELFRARRTTKAARIAREARQLLTTLTAVLNRVHPILSAQVNARIPTKIDRPWQRLPALSIALAACARLAAHGVGAFAGFERANRSLWTDLSAIAPMLTVVDLVLAEILIVAPEVSR